MDLWSKTADISKWSKRMRESLEKVYGDKLQSMWDGFNEAMTKLFKAGGDVCKAQAAKVQCPTFLLHGAKDPMVADCHPTFFKDTIKDCKLHVFEAGKHNIHLKYAA